MILDSAETDAPKQRSLQITHPRDPSSRPKPPEPPEPLRRHLDPKPASNFHSHLPVGQATEFLDYRTVRHRTARYRSHNRTFSREHLPEVPFAPSSIQP